MSPAGWVGVLAQPSPAHRDLAGEALKKPALCCFVLFCFVSFRFGSKYWLIGPVAFALPLLIYGMIVLPIFGSRL